MTSDDFNMVVAEVTPTEADRDFAQPPKLAQVLNMVRPTWQSRLFGDFGDQFGASHFRVSLSSDKKTPEEPLPVAGASRALVLSRVGI
jgi:hypothetical protein